MPYSEYKPTKREWLVSRFHKWCQILLAWFGVLFILLIIQHFYFKESGLTTMIAGWLGMFLNDLLYQTGLKKPHDRDKLEIVYRRDK